MLKGMRFPSLRTLADEAWSAARRFPLPLLCALAATACALWSIEATRDDELPVRGLQTALLGLPLLLAVTLVRERAAADARARRFAHALLACSVAALVLFFLAWPSWTWTGGWTRFLHLAFACHLLVAFLPFLGPGQLHSFWTFNRALFLRFLLSTLFAGVLCGGAALALFGLDELLGLGVDSDFYLRTFVLVGLLFHPWHFLGGVPRTCAQPDDRGLPAALRVFAQYLLVPLVAAYLLLLDAYVVRLIVLQRWPVRSLGYLVAAAAVAGLLALLLLYPLRAKTEYRWIDHFERGFHVLLLPPAIVLLISLGRRVGHYGLTERRYLLAMLALWLVGFSLFQLVTRSRNTKLLSISLTLLALLTFGGPWSAYAASRWEQRQRLVSLLEASDLLDGLQASKPTTTLPFEARRSLSGSVTYLLEAHGPDALSPWLDGVVAGTRDAAPERRSASIEPRARAVLDELGVGYVDRWTAVQPPSREPIQHYAPPDAAPLDVSAYSWALRFSIAGATAASFTVGNETWTLEHVGSQPLLRLRSTGAPSPTGANDGLTIAEIPLAPLLERLRAASANRLDGTVDRARLAVPFAAERVRGVVVFEQIYGARDGDQLHLDQLNGELFFELAPNR